MSFKYNDKSDHANKVCTLFDEEIYTEANEANEIYPGGHPLYVKSMCHLSQVHTKQRKSENTVYCRINVCACQIEMKNTGMFIL